MKIFVVSRLIFVAFIISASTTSASTLDPLYEEVPASFVVNSFDSFSGVTTGGYTFSQNRIVSGQSIRIHKFSIADRFFYVSDRGVIEAVSDISAVSIYLSLLG